MKKIVFGWMLLLGLSVAAQNAMPRPRLVVGIMVDQMRADFLYRFADRYGNNGFKRLLREGFSCENTFINFIPTYTAPGHASVYTGSVPALNGIIGNNWYSRELNRTVYCTEDSLVQTVGSASNAGQQSPRNLWASTITDELRLATNGRSKTVGIALKDRGAILPAGHTSNGAYWFDNATGGWISSTFYMDSLPRWVQQLNARKLPDAYLAKNWQTLYPLNTYTQSTADNKPYEGKLGGKGNVFQHPTSEFTNNKYEVFRGTPGGNTFTFDMARAAIEGEGMGRNGQTDFLAVSFSSPDYIGHTFGPNSVEIEDTYLRFDRELGDFLQYLDTKVGKGNYLVFLTADHAVAHVPGFAQEWRLPAGTVSSAAIRDRLNKGLSDEFKATGLITSIINGQVYLNHDNIRKAELDRAEVGASIVRRLLLIPEVAQAMVLGGELPLMPERVRMMVANGYNHKLSGDVQFLYKPQFFEGGSVGTTHGAWHNYDSHIPLLWFGWNIKPGKSNREVHMTDIAPTLAAMLRIQMPNAATGKVIEEVVK